jgi:CDP-diacylglycerol--glycerol-3-phosphate 3-phosphatidyltransferase/cardiolipin synthase
MRERTGRMLSVPNLLTLSRIVALPLLAFLLWWPTGQSAMARLRALLPDGDHRLLRRYLARASGAVSRLGVFLDPVADKIMVATVILVLTAQGVLRGPVRGRHARDRRG